MRITAAVFVSMLLLAGIHTRPVNACTTFTHKAADGIVFAGNMDLMVPVGGLVVVNRRGIAKRNIRPNQNGTIANWITRFGSVSFNIAGRGFAWGGLNEAGLAIQTLEVRTEVYPSARKNYTSTGDPNTCEDGMGDAAIYFGIETHRD